MQRLVRQEEVLARTGLSRTSVWRLEKAGTFPKRFKLDPNGGPHGAVGWAALAIDRHVDSLVQARDADSKLKAADKENDEAVKADAERDGDEVEADAEEVTVA